MNYRHMLWLLCSLVMVGCSSLPEQKAPVDWSLHHQQLIKIQLFSVAGKLGYISPEKRQALNFHWEHTPSSNHFRLSTFLGQTVLRIDANQSGATAQTYDDKTYKAPTIESLLIQLTGLDIPIEPLQYWILGLPNETDSFTLNPNNTLKTLSKEVAHQHWQVQYQQYSPVPFQQSHLPLPIQLSLENKTTKIRLKITQWDLPTSAL